MAYGIKPKQISLLFKMDDVPWTDVPATRVRPLRSRYLRVSHRKKKDIIIWMGILFEKRTSLLHIVGSLPAQRYTYQVVSAVVWPLVQFMPGKLFQQINVWPYIAQRYLKSVDEIDMIPWLIASLDHSPMEYKWTTSDICCIGHYRSTTGTLLRGAVCCSGHGLERSNSEDY